MADKNLMHLPFGFNVNPDDYEEMVESIANKKQNYQYFMGNAFLQHYSDGGNSLRMRNAIWGEVRRADSMMKKYKIWEDNDLVSNLLKKKEQYEKMETNIYLRLVEILKRLAREGGTSQSAQSMMIINEHQTPPTSADSVAQKIEKWDSLLKLDLGLLTSDGNELDFSKDPSAALYCFLKSREMYDVVKNIPAVRIYLNSGKKDTKTEDQFFTEMEEIGDTIGETFFTDGKDAKEGSFISSMIEGLQEAALNGLLASGNNNAQQTSTDIISFVRRSYGQKKKSLQGLSAIEQNKLLSEWAAEKVVQINKKLKADGFEDYLITKFEVKNGKITFFRIDASKNTDSVKGKKSEAAVIGIKQCIENFIKTKTGSNFSLRVAPNYNEYWFANGTAEAALKKLYVLDKSNIELFMRDKKYLKSNSFISSVLGELAEFVNPMVEGINSKLMTNETQKYFRKWDTSEKSSGEHFSNLVIDGIDIPGLKGLHLGFNIHNYVTERNSFELVPPHTSGIGLNDVWLSRYLTEKEIYLLKFIEANEKLISYLPPATLAARGIMNKNIAQVFRITSIDTDVINYIIVANGHYIPASCIFQYAAEELINDRGWDYKFFSVIPGNITYERPKSDSYEEETSIKNLMIDSIYKEQQSLKYRFNKFTISVKQLLKL